MSKQEGISRREFIQQTSLAAVGTAFALGAPGGGLLAEEQKKSRVVLIRDKDVIDPAGKPRDEVVCKMLDSAVAALTGQGEAVSAWKSLFKPTDVVGIKTNVWKYISTTPQVEQAIKKGLLAAGVAEASIAIDDRGVLSNPVFQKASALVNARPMRTHHWSGVGSLIKNYIMFAPKPPDYHPDSCADLAKLWTLPVVKGKTRLNVLVMLTTQFHSVGPHGFSPQHIWTYGGLLVGVDPVAVDATGLRILQAKRKEYFKEERPFSPPAKHIQLADTRHHLGTADPGKIELIKLGFTQDSLI